MLELNNITISVSGRDLFRLNQLTLNTGLYALVGRNGSGKSTFLRTILGEHALYAGQVKLNGNDIKVISKSERAKLISVVYSRPGIFGNHSVFEVLLLGRLPYQDMLARVSEEDRDAVKNVIELLELDSFASRQFSILSDGEKQLVMIGRALVQDTPVLVLDEPGAFLDLVNRYKLSAILKKIVSDTGKLIIYSTHHIDLLENYCEGVLLIKNGEMQQLSPASGFTNQIKKTFGLQ